MKSEIVKNINELVPIESAGFDFSELEGRKGKIEIISILEVPSAFTETGKQKVLKIETEVLDVITNKEKEKIDLRASEIFNLSTTKDGALGWSKSPNASLNKFLIKLKVKSPDELKDKYVIIKTRTKKNAQGQDKTFLGFITE